MRKAGVLRSKHQTPMLQKEMWLPLWVHGLRSRSPPFHRSCLLVGLANDGFLKAEGSRECPKYLQGKEVRASPPTFQLWPIFYLGMGSCSQPGQAPHRSAFALSSFVETTSAQDAVTGCVPPRITSVIPSLWPFRPYCCHNDPRSQDAV